MTRKDYEKAAELIKSAEARYGTHHRKALVMTFTEFFSNDNPRFDVNRFQAACLPVEVK